MQGSKLYVGNLTYAVTNEQLEELHPGAIDNVETDEAVRDLGRFLGVKENHIRTIAKRNKLRAERQRQQAVEEQLKVAQITAQAYGQTNQAPAPGSPAESLKEAL